MALAGGVSRVHFNEGAVSAVICNRPLRGPKFLIAAVVLASACAETRDLPIGAESHRDPPTVGQPCDPHGIGSPSYTFGEVPIELELFPDEVALRGRCSPAAEAAWPPRGDYARELSESAAKREREWICDGVCEPMRQRLPAFVEDHDLEDATFEAECKSATAVLRADLRGSCLRVCVVERRRLSAPIVYARTLRAMDAVLAGRTMGAPQALGAYLATNHLGAPPSSIRFAYEDVQGHVRVTAEGWLYPGGPLLRLRTQELDGGCGTKGVGVARW